MLERIYAWFLHLYPAAFQRAFGEEAVQLVRDRLRDERGLIARVRLCGDLVTDVAISVPREFRYAQPSLAGAPPPRLQAGPAFTILEGKPPTPVSMALAGFASLAFFAGVGFLIGHGGGHLIMRSLSMHPERQLSGPGFAPERAPQQPGAGVEAANIGAAKSAVDAAPQMADAAAAVEPRQSGSLTVTAAKTGRPALVEMDTAYTRWVVAEVAANLKYHYFDRVTAAQLADGMQSRVVSGAYDRVPNDRTLAQLLTRQLRASTGDLHLEVVYDASVLPHASDDPTATQMARYRQAMETSNCTIEKAEVLPDDIGYIKLDSFPDPAICGTNIAGAMTSLNHADAIIFDLRDNSGGFPGGVMQVASYLFARPQSFYNPRGVSAAESTTRTIAGNLLADKPVYVLTSHITLSGAEQFAYNLKMLKRATLVGETTGGGAHAGVFHRIDDHFGMGIPEVKVVNPYGKSDWEGVGVAPDVEVQPSDGLETAERLAGSKLREK